MARDENSRLVYSTGGGETEKALSGFKKGSGRPPRKGESAPPISGAKAGIRLRLEKRASDRLATVITGLPGKPDEVAELARSLKKGCGTGGAFKDGVLELQGDQREKVEAALGARGLKSKRAGG